MFRIFERKFLYILFIYKKNIVYIYLYIAINTFIGPYKELYRVSGYGINVFIG